jgi:formate dehydrogenase major subunit
VDVPGSEFEVYAETVILATGQFPETSWVDLTQLLDDKLRLLKYSDGTTGLDHVFVAGDFGQGATTIIQAVAHAKQCARRVDEFLVQSKRLHEVVHIGAMFQSKAQDGKTTGRRPEMNRIPLHPMPLCPPPERDRIREVELGYSKSTAVEAASRCYLCHYKFEILDDRCVLCDECLQVKPVAGCIVEVSGLLQDDDGAVVGYEKIIKGSTASLYYSRLWIDQNQCIRCGACEAVCPVNAITIQKVNLGTRVERSDHESNTRKPTLHGD